MPIKHKHSPTPGNRANLTPGEIGHNRAEDKLLIRGDQRKLEIDLYDWRHRSLPPGGTPGSPLSRDINGDLIWDADQLPVGQIGGGYYTDGGPGVAGWSVPGWVSTENYNNNTPGVISSTNLQPQTLFIEDFYLASDSIIITHLGTRFVWPDSNRSPLRIGIADAEGNILRQVRDNAPGNLWTAPIEPLTLTRGKYSLLLYNHGPITAPPINLNGLRSSQGFNYNNGAISFLKRRRAQADMLGGLYLDNGLVITEDRSAEPGEFKSVFMRWLLPLPADTVTGALATPSTLSAERTGSGTVTTAATTVSVQGGSGFYTYAWTPPPGVSVSDPAASSVTFSKSMTAGDSFSGSASVTATDILTGASATTSVNIALECKTAGSGGGGGGYPIRVSVSPNGGTEYASPGSTVTVCFDYSSNAIGNEQHSWGGDGSGCYSVDIPPGAPPGWRTEIFGTVAVWDDLGGIGSGGGRVTIIVA